MRKMKCTVCEQNLTEDNFAPSHRCREQSRCRDCLNKIKRERYRSNEEKRQYHREYYQKNKHRLLPRVKQYKKENWEKIRSDPRRKVRKSQAKRIKKALERAGSEKKLSTLKYVGCNANELKEHIEGQFKEGMSWDNYGLYGWHIDHIVPLAQFDLLDLEEQKKAFHYTNLQPLWAEENLKKGGGYWAD
tara:strand:- start:405 stop:971 length:567 start_codon:yes stop_codon:yes gene_type:complete